MMTSFWRAVLAWVLLFTLSVTSIWMMIAPDLEDIEQMETTYARKKTLLTRLQALPKEESAIRARLERLSREAVARQLYDGNNNAVQSLVQRDLRQLASDNQLTINSMRPLGAVQQAGLLRRTSVQLNLALSHKMLVSFLQTVENWEPILRVTRLNIRVRAPSSDASSAELAVTMEVTGYSEAAVAGRRS